MEVNARRDQRIVENYVDTAGEMISGERHATPEFCS